MNLSDVKKMTAQDLIAFSAAFLLVFLFVRSTFGRTGTCEGFSHELMSDLMNNPTMPPLMNRLQKTVSFTPGPMMRSATQAPMMKKPSIMKNVPHTKEPHTDTHHEGEPSPFLKYTSYAPYSSTEPAKNEWSSCGPMQPPPGPQQGPVAPPSSDLLKPKPMQPMRPLSKTATRAPSAQMKMEENFTRRRR